MPTNKLASLLVYVLKAAREAALLAAMQQEPQLPPSGHMRFDTFVEYKRVAKRQQQDIEDEELEQQDGAKRMRPQQLDDPYVHHVGAPAAGVRQRPSSAGGADAKEAAIKELRDFIKVFGDLYQEYSALH